MLWELRSLMQSPLAWRDLSDYTASAVIQGRQGILSLDFTLLTWYLAKGIVRVGHRVKSFPTKESFPLSKRDIR